MVMKIFLLDTGIFMTGSNCKRWCSLLKPVNNWTNWRKPVVLMKHVTWVHFLLYYMSSTCLHVSTLSNQGEHVPWMTYWHFSCPPDVTTTSPNLMPFGAMVSYWSWIAFPPVLEMALETPPWFICRYERLGLIMASTCKIRTPYALGVFRLYNVGRQI